MDALDKLRNGRGQFARRRFLSQLDEVEGIRREIDECKSQQHSHAASQRVDEELEGCVGAIFSTPDLDEEVHRDEAQFPEDEPMKEIERREHPKHARLQE